MIEATESPSSVPPPPFETDTDLLPGDDPPDTPLNDSEVGLREIDGEFPIVNCTVATCEPFAAAGDATVTLATWVPTGRPEALAPNVSVAGAVVVLSDATNHPVWAPE